MVSSGRRLSSVVPRPSCRSIGYLRAAGGHCLHSEVGSVELKAKHCCTWTSCGERFQAEVVVTSSYTSGPAAIGSENIIDPPCPVTIPQQPTARPTNTNTMSFVEGRDR
jgi:hypothetical protein